jgi:hypothetical protein
MNDDEKTEEDYEVQNLYFDRRVEEEDEPVIVDEESNIKCELLNDMYDDFFDEDFLSTAKVIIMSNIAKL